MLFEPADDEHGILRGHVARGNPHWREIADDGTTEAIAIFNGPDASISPAGYQEKRLTGKVVPTWNYTTVVAHGRLTLHHEPDWLLPHSGGSSSVTRPHGPNRGVDDAPADFVALQGKAIVGLELASSGSRRSASSPSTPARPTLTGSSMHSPAARPVRRPSRPRCAGSHPAAERNRGPRRGPPGA